MTIFTHDRDMAHTQNAPPIRAGTYDGAEVYYPAAEALRGHVAGCATFAAGPDHQFLARAVELIEHPDGSWFLRTVDIVDGQRDNDDTGRVEFFDGEHEASHAFGHAVTRLTTSPRWRRQD